MIDTRICGEGYGITGRGPFVSATNLGASPNRERVAGLVAAGSLAAVIAAFVLLDRPGCPYPMSRTGIRRRAYSKMRRMR
jgi:hypothetical protein